MSELKSFEPATGNLVWEGSSGNPDEAISAALSAWPIWAAQSLSDRIGLIRRYSNSIKQDSDQLAELIARETGKPLWEAREEVASTITIIDMAINAYAERTSQRRLPGGSQYQSAVRHKPHGVIVVLTPFSSPAKVANGHIIPALLAGNSVILKPSEKAPAVGEFFSSAAQRAGLPEGVFNLVQGGPDVGQALANNPEINGLFFTGAAHNGIAIHRAFSNRPGTMLSLEMGGNNPIIAWDTSDIPSAAALIIQSAFRNAGQLCTAARRLIVKDSIAPALIGEMKRLTGRLIIDQPLAETQPFMGPLIDLQTADGLTESFLALMSHSGKPITHMRRPQEDLPYVIPGIIDVTDMEERPDLELFGPILQVIRVTEFEQAIAEANATRYGLCAALIGGTAEQFDKFWSLGHAGHLNWNRTTHSIAPEAPSGGFGLSGNLRPGGFYAADHCAYPVVSQEVETPRAMIGIGMANENDGSEDETPERA